MSGKSRQELRQEANARVNKALDDVGRDSPSADDVEDESTAPTPAPADDVPPPPPADDVEDEASAPAREPEDGMPSDPSAETTTRKRQKSTKPDMSEDDFDIVAAAKAQAEHDTDARQLKAFRLPKGLCRDIRLFSVTYGVAEQNIAEWAIRKWLGEQRKKLAAQVAEQAS